MTATNSVGIKTGNISAGTSAFAMVVLEKPLTRVYENLDIVTTPDGKPVAMAHSNTVLLISTPGFTCSANVCKPFRFHTQKTDYTKYFFKRHWMAAKTAAVCSRTAFIRANTVWV